MDVERGPRRTGGEVDDPAAGADRPREVAPEDPRCHLDRLDLMDVHDAHWLVCGCHAPRLNRLHGRQQTPERRRTALSGPSATRAGSAEGQRASTTRARNACCAPPHPSRSCPANDRSTDPAAWRAAPPRAPAGAGSDDRPRPATRAAPVHSRRGQGRVQQGGAPRRRAGQPTAVRVSSSLRRRRSSAPSAPGSRRPMTSQFARDVRAWWTR